MPLDVDATLSNGSACPNATAEVDENRNFAARVARHRRRPARPAGSARAVERDGVVVGLLKDVDLERIPIERLERHFGNEGLQRQQIGALPKIRQWEPGLVRTEVGIPHDDRAPGWRLSAELPETVHPV